MRRLIIIFVVAVIGTLVLGLHDVRAAILYPVAPTTEVPLNATVSVDLRLDSEGEIVNAVEAGLIYDPASLEVVSISRGNSFITLWTERPAIVAPGRMTLSGGRPDGSLVVDGNVVTVSFRTLRLGSTTVAVQPALSGVYLHDSQATAASLTARSLELRVIDAPTILAQPRSPSHPIEGVWSRNRDVVLEWTPFQGAVVSYRISRDPVAVPDEVVEDNNGRAGFPSLADGVWYLTFIEKFGNQAWSTVFRREFRIDGTPPLPFELAVVKDGTQAFVAFSADDRESGIVRYEARVDRSRWWMPWLTTTHRATVTGPFALEDIAHVARVSVTAYDGAGNTQTATMVGPERQDLNRLALLIFGAVVGLCGTLLVVLRRSRSRRTGGNRQRS